MNHQDATPRRPRRPSAARDLPAGGIGLGRRDLLRFTGAAAGALAVPAVLGGAGAGVAQATGLASSSPDLLDGGEYPIGFWWPPPPAETTVARYAEIADAGFTFVTGGNGVQNLPINAAMLDAADANGLAAVVIDNRISWIHDHPREQWRDIVEQTVRDYRPFPAFRGFNIRDEPGAGEFAQIGAVNDILRRVAPDLLGYVNLFPTYASPEMLGTPTYEDYLERYVAAGNPEFISFDHYMLLAAGGIRADYFHNWSLVRSRSLESGLPSWVFILACEHHGAYPLPTEAELLWQINVSLAYGCKGIQYFTYWTPEPPELFQEALVSHDGELLPLYYAARRINKGYLSRVGRELLPLTSESVSHANEDPLPMGAPGFTGDDWVVSAEGSAVLLGRFADSHRPNQRWLLVANRAFDAAATARLDLGDRVAAVFEFDPAAERYRPCVPAGRDTGAPALTVELAPGAARLYRLHADASA